MTKDSMLIAGNWKMNGLSAALAELQEIAAGLPAACAQADIAALVCLPASLLSRGAEAVRNSRLALGGQDCHFADSGAHTGDIAAPMLKDAGASYVIVGHSERRADHCETDELIHRKAEAAWRAGLVAVLCVGETLEQREQGAALEIVGRQCEAAIPAGAAADRLVIAYEPVWAIGTGKVPTRDNVAEMHNFIRQKLHRRFGEMGEKIRLLYGGSVKPDNAAALLSVPHVHGALIGGASLNHKDFLAIIAAAATLP
ncbi:MAG: triose-phosphate isomerase [Candidatus Tokpelaia sp.]|nr:MAG: triose-phosphate isomerase [Candidatus Tokpelaia sp.]KAA6207848.1 MAG: triose-phosphate isomerase [Candidatus Tokpelaia sp.]